MAVTFRAAILSGQVRSKRFYCVSDILSVSCGALSLPAEFNSIKTSFTVVDLEADSFTSGSSITEIAFVKCHVSDGMMEFKENEIKDACGEGRGEVFQLLEQASSTGELFVSHNAAYDKRQIKQAFDINHDRWFCTLSGISWDSYGYNSKSLEYLLFKNRLFYTAHGALADAQALIALLATHPAELQNVSPNKRRITVKGVGGAHVDVLASMGYVVDLKTQKATVFVESEMVDAEIFNLSQVNIRAERVAVS